MVSTFYLNNYLFTYFCVYEYGCVYAKVFMESTGPDLIHHISTGLAP